MILITAGATVRAAFMVIWPWIRHMMVALGFFPANYYTSYEAPSLTKSVKTDVLCIMVSWIHNWVVLSELYLLVEWSNLLLLKWGGINFALPPNQIIRNKLWIFFFNENSLCCTVPSTGAQTHACLSKNIAIVRKQGKNLWESGKKKTACIN